MNFLRQYINLEVNGISIAFILVKYSCTIFPVCYEKFSWSLFPLLRKTTVIYIHPYTYLHFVYLHYTYLHFVYRVKENIIKHWALTYFTQCLTFPLHLYTDPFVPNAHFLIFLYIYKYYTFLYEKYSHQALYF